MKKIIVLFVLLFVYGCATGATVEAEFKHKLHNTKFEYNSLCEKFKEYKSNCIACNKKVETLEGYIKEGDKIISDLDVLEKNKFNMEYYSYLDKFIKANKDLKKINKEMSSKMDNV